MGSQNGLNKNGHELCNRQVEREGKLKVDELSPWANHLPLTKEQDAFIVNNMKELVRQQETNPLLSDDDIIDHFHSIMAFPLQTACHVSKWFH